MRIVRCSKCKRYLINEKNCFYCGNTSVLFEAEMPDIHENVVAEYAKVQTLIEDKQFSEAFMLSHLVVEWMPNLAGIFWLRLLAKNQCTNSAELIQKGFDCEEDPDFCNAMIFSSGAERSAYQNVCSVVLAIQEALKTQIKNHKFLCIRQTKLLQIHNSMKTEVEVRQRKLFSLWIELEKTEHAMFILEKDCILLAKEHVDTLNRTAQESSSIKSKAYLLENCEADTLHRYQTEIGAILQQSTQAKDILDSMGKQHPWVKSFIELFDKRHELVEQITNEISSLKKYEATVQQTLDEIDLIEQRHNTAIRAIDDFVFLDAANLLGKDIYTAVLRNSGFLGDISLPASACSWQPDTAKSTQLIDDDSDDFYDTWGLPNDSY